MRSEWPALGILSLLILLLAVWIWHVQGLPEGPLPPPNQTAIDLGRRARNNLAAIKIRERDWPGAVDILVPVVTEAPWYADANVNLGVCLHERGREVRGDYGRFLLDCARGYYQRALQIEPGHKPAQEALKVLIADRERM